MRTLKLIIPSALMVVVLLQACNTKNNAEVAVPAVQETQSTKVDIFGKTATITFPIFQVDETFVSDSVLHWKIVDDKGNLTEADEKISYKRLNDSQFFLNWIEKSGLTVSQVLDFQKGTVVAFVSRTDESSERGKRAANFFEGTLKTKD